MSSSALLGALTSRGWSPICRIRCRPRNPWAPVTSSRIHRACRGCPPLGTTSVGDPGAAALVRRSRMACPRPTGAAARRSRVAPDRRRRGARRTAMVRTGRGRRRPTPGTGMASEGMASAGSRPAAPGPARSAMRASRARVPARLPHPEVQQRRVSGGSAGRSTCGGPVQVDDRGLDADRARAAVEHEVDGRPRGRRRRGRRVVGLTRRSGWPRCGEAPPKSQQLQRQRVSRHPHTDGRVRR